MRRAVIVDALGNLVRGMAMGAADVVPGVSGGTVALLLGIYDRLVGEIAGLSGAASRVLRGRVADGWTAARRADWIFLGSLLAGILLCVITLVELVRILIEERPVALSAAFFGLVAMTAVVTRREVGNWNAGRMAACAVVAVATFVALGVRTADVVEPSGFIVFGAGAVAICAMILPGVSGSFVLLMLGLYEPITEAVVQRRLGTIALFGLGVAAGLAVFSRGLERLLARHRDTVVVVLIGLMAGSLRVLWPWPDTAGDAASFGNAALGAPQVTQVWWASAIALGAAGFAYGLHRIGDATAAQGGRGRDA